MPFESDLVVSETDEKHWRLAADLMYRGRHDLFVVPSGFVTDFASVPRVLWSLIPTYGRYTKAAVLHDYLVRERAISRCDADGLFRRVMREMGVGYVRRRMMWAGVRWGGKVASCGPGQFLAVLLITILSFPLVIPGVVAALFIVLLWLVEVLVHGVRLALGLDEPGVPPLFPR